MAKAGTRQKAEPMPDDRRPHRALRDAVEALAARYLDAYAREDAAGCAAEFTAGARLDHPFGPPGVGRAEIAGLHAEWFAEDERDKRMWAIEVERSGQTCHVLFGWSALTGPPDADPQRRSAGVSLAILRDEGEGAGDGWRIHRMALVPGAA